MRLFAHHPQTNEQTLTEATVAAVPTAAAATAEAPAALTKMTKATSRRRTKRTNSSCNNNRVNNRPLILGVFAPLRSSAVVEIDVQRLSFDSAGVQDVRPRLLMEFGTFRGSRNFDKRERRNETKRHKHAEIRGRHQSWRSLWRKECIPIREMSREESSQQDCNHSLHCALSQVGSRQFTNDPKI